LKAKPIVGAPMKMNAKQMAKLAKIIREKNPLQLNFEYALWTLAIDSPLDTQTVRRALERSVRRAFDEAPGLHPPAAAVSGVATKP